MVRAARWFVAHVAPKLVFLRDVYPEYKVRLLGHSLGAGVATLACLLLRSHDQLSDIECIAFAPPACISSELAGDASACVTSIVNRDDLLSYMSYQTTSSIMSMLMPFNPANLFRGKQQKDVSMTKSKSTSHSKEQRCFFRFAEHVICVLFATLDCQLGG